MPRPVEGKKNISLYIDEEVYKWARKHAIDEGRPFTEILGEVIEEWGKRGMARQAKSGK